MKLSYYISMNFDGVGWDPREFRDGRVFFNFRTAFYQCLYR